MNLAWISLAALIIAITLSMVTSVNVGVVSLALAWIVGVYLGGMRVAAVIGTFPIDLLINLVGITLLFGMANNNGTLGRMAARAVRACRGNAGVMPIMFFFIAVTLASIGPGNIATTAIMAPMAMAVAMRATIPPFLMALMVGNGAQAGALSPVAPTGLIVKDAMTAIGLGGHEISTYLNNLMAHVVVTFVAYFVLGGWKLFARKRVAPVQMAQSDQAGARGDEEVVDVEPFEPRHWLTLAILITLVVVVIQFKAHVGLAALTGAAILSLLKAADEKDAIKKMPWGVIVMVCGVTVLIGVLSAQRGIDLFTDLLATIATPGTVTFMIALVTGAVSVYSSTSGVVLPAFLPTVPGLAARLGADPLSIAASMYVGGHLVDLSPLSTIGALCIAALPNEQDARKLFNQLLAWGLSMMLVGAVICWILF
ncbi:MAG: C4-dicarboxylate ABC transporter [Cyanobacteria bacterium]|nr:C4-dicarboxylate ABC transporter [Cyanobacteriota bacterium]